MKSKLQYFLTIGLAILAGLYPDTFQFIGLTIAICLDLYHWNK
jgi:hypothetical protein